MKDHVDDFLNATVDARDLSEKCRDYFDGIQWTTEERAEVKARGHAPIVNNRIKPKVEGLKGLTIMRRTDPKAYSRTPKHEKSSIAATDALRYVKDNNDIDDIMLDVAENIFIEGYGGAITQYDEVRDEIVVEQIPWDRIYYDPHSRKRDFSDAMFMGIMIWMNKEQFKNTFPKSRKWDSIVNSYMSATLGETFEDRPRWYKDGSKDEEQRVLIAQEYFLKNGVWNVRFFSGNVEIIKAQESPDLDDRGEPTNPIELGSGYINRNNDRRGEVMYMLDLQDEINHRRSKALALLSFRQTASRKGAITDIEKMKRNMAHYNGHIEYKGERGDFEILNTNDMVEGQFALLQQSMAELDSKSYNAQLAGQRQGELSGNAVEKLQSAGMMEIQSLYNGLKGLEKRIYKQIWYRIKQNWTGEKWVKVTDDYKNLRYVGLNTEITFGEKLQEIAQDKSKPDQDRQQAQMVLQGLSEAQDERLNQVVQIQNPVAEMDMDIIIDHSPDTINIQQEQFRLIVDLARADNSIPFHEVLRMSDLRGKDEIIERAIAREQQAAQTQEQIQQIAVTNADAESKAKVKKDVATATKTSLEAMTAQIKNELMVENPDKITSLSG